MLKLYHIQRRSSGFGLQRDFLLDRHPLRVHRHWRTLLYGTDRGWTIPLGQLPFASSG